MSKKQYQNFIDLSILASNYFRVSLTILLKVIKICTSVVITVCLFSFAGSTALRECSLHHQAGICTKKINFRHIYFGVGTSSQHHPSETNITFQTKKQYQYILLSIQYNKSDKNNEFIRSQQTGHYTLYVWRWKKPA